MHIRQGLTTKLKKKKKFKNVWKNIFSREKKKEFGIQKLTSESLKTKAFLLKSARIPFIFSYEILCLVTINFLVI